MSGEGHRVHAAGNPGVYIHVPFCVKKCNYCAFVSGPASEERRAEYVDALIKEIMLASEGEVEGTYLTGGIKPQNIKCDTIFIGGGTPSLLTVSQIERILDTVRGVFDVTDDAEITMEANPATLDKEALAGYLGLGVNRLSMGVQSMDDEVLATLGRIHTVDDVIRDYEAAREAGFNNINFDLMFGVPGTDVEGVVDGVQRVIDLGPEHVSYYSLQLEEGTKFWQDFENGQFHEIPDEVDREMYHRGRMLLKENGYKHYEISNFAKPGFESRHNSKYWSMADYYGFGLGASSYVKGVRIMNTPDMPEYLATIAGGRLPQVDIHVNSEHDDISEAVFTGLRRNFGIKFADILGSKEKFYEYYKEVIPALESFEETGHIIIDDEGFTLSNLGIDISNKIMALFV